jgi:hypothetical protein
MQLSATITILTQSYFLYSLQTGHSEHAVGCIQALIEFLCYSPAPIGSLGASTAGGGSRAYSYGAQLRLFASYWESGAPRIGEEGGSGWAAWFRWVGSTGIQ